MSHEPADNRRRQGGFLRLLPCADTLGICASTLCLIHCLAVPLAIALLPALAGKFVHDDRTHYFLAFFVAAFCILGVLPGYLRHSRLNVLLLMIVGLSLVLFATFLTGSALGERFEIPIITAGNLCVVAAHWRNRKLLACQH